MVKHKNILLIVFMLTLFVFQQVQAGGSMPSARKKSETNAQLAVGWADVISIRIYPLDLGTGFIVGSDTCVWDTDPDTPIVDGCGPYEPDFTGTVYQDSTVDCNDRPEDPYPRKQNDYYYLCIDGDYLPDVLPREINILEIRPPEPEALKALAVASRTFVKYKAPLAPGGVIDNSSASYQVYVPWSRSDEYFGVNYKYEMETAVNSTSGQYLSYNGNVIDAEYSSEVFDETQLGGQNYLIPVKEPISSRTCTTQGTTGNSWGISQRGAIRWAQGSTCPDGSGTAWPVSGATPMKWDYKQILVHYYTGVSIAGTNTPNDRWNMLKYENIPSTMTPGQTITNASVWLQNTSTQPWTDAVLGYQWIGPNDTSGWTEIPLSSLGISSLATGMDANKSIDITAPTNGSYTTLRFDVKHAGGAWFSTGGWPDAQIPVQVNGSPVSTSTPIVTSTPAPTCNPTPGDDPYADCVIDFQANGNANGWKNPSMVVGAPNCPSWNFMSLGGGGGYVVVDMGAGEEIINQLLGPDLKVYEAGSGCGGINETYEAYARNSPSDPWVFLGTGSGVTTFDLGGNLPRARYVKIVDSTGINNSSGTPGADIDAIEALKPGYTCEDDWEHWFNSCEEASSNRSNPQYVKVSSDLSSTINSLQQTAADAQLFYRVRDELLNLTPNGSQLSNLYYQYGPEIGEVLLLNPELDQEGLALLHYWEPKLQALLDGQGNTVVISQEEVDAIDQFLSGLEAVASTDLRTTIQNERTSLNTQGLVGQTMSQAWNQISGVATDIPTPTGTPTSTPTATQTPTDTPTATPTSTATQSCGLVYTSQPDGTAGTDTYISSLSPSTTHETSTVIDIGEENATTGYYRRGLVQFDLSTIPSDATICSAALSLTVISSSEATYDRVVHVYRMKSAWSEQTGTWNVASTGVNWQVAGAGGENDRETTDIGSLLVPANAAQYSEQQWALDPLKIQEMVNGTFVNNGFLLQPDTELDDMHAYYSSDYSSNPSRRPKLVIQYSVPSGTVTPTQTPTPTPTGTPTPTSTPAGEAYTVSLLHMNGVDGSTAFTDQTGKTWTAHGNAQIDTAQSKFGGASLLSDGTADYITTPHHADFDLNGDFTIDFWMRFNSTTSDQIFLYKDDGASGWYMSWSGSSSSLRFQNYTNSTRTINISRSWSPNTGQWYHLALVGSGNDYRFFVDGNQLGTIATDTDPITNTTASLSVGATSSGSWCLNGWIDEVRFSNGIARWTSNFTPPVSE